MAFEFRILYLTGSLEAGGLERFVSKVSLKAKHENRFQPIIVCLSKRMGLFLKELEESGILVLEAPKHWQRSPLALFRLGILLGKQRPTVVHSQVNFSLIQQWFITKIFTRAKFMVTERNCYPLKGLALARRRIQFHFLRLAGVHYSGNSNEVVKYLARMVLYPERKIPLIPNGIEIPVIDPNVRNFIREKQKWNSNDFVIGYVSRFASHKGQGYFFQVILALHQSLGDRLKVCFIGDGPMRLNIEEIVSFSKISHLVTFLGIVDNVADYYQAFDCTALMSEYEGMPNAVLEAMAYGLPVVANPVGNVVQLFENGSGVINRYAEPSKTANIFLELATDSKKCTAIGRLAREKVRLNFSLQHTFHLLSIHYNISHEGNNYS